MHAYIHTMKNTPGTPTQEGLGNDGPPGECTGGWGGSQEQGQRDRAVREVAKEVTGLQVPRQIQVSLCPLG